MHRKYTRLLIAGACLALSALAARVADAAPAWYRAETAHFVVYSDADEQATRDYLAKLESFYVTASSFYLTVSDSAIEYKQKPVFYYIKTVEDDYTIFPRLKTPGDSSGTHVTLYSTCPDGETDVYTDADFMTTYFDGDYRFLAPNLFLKRVYTSKGLPTWVSTGMYSYVLNADIQKDKIVVGKPSAWQTINPADPEASGFPQKYVPFAEIIADTITSTKNRSALPAQYWLMMDYMLSTPENRQKLSHYVELVAGGKPSAAAFKEAIGIDPSFFDQLIKDYTKHGFPVIEYKVTALDPKAFQLDKLADYGEPVPLLSAAAQACTGPTDASAVIARLQKAAQANPGDGYVQRELARSQIVLGHPQDAKPWLDAELAKSPNDYDVKYLEGRYYLDLAENGDGPGRAANYAKARASLGQAYKLSETNGSVLYYYARAFEDQPDFPNANTVMAARAANDLMPGAGFKNYLNGLLIKSGRMVDEYSQSIDEKPTVDDYISRSFYRPETQYAEKLADLNAAIALGPDSDLPYIARSEFYLTHDNAAAALTDASTAVDIGANDYRALDARALVYLQMAKPDLASKDLDKSIYENQTPTAMNAACWSLATHGYADRALPFCNRAISKSSYYAGAVDSRAFAELRLNQLDAAAADYTHALDIAPNLPTSWYGLGLVRIKQGKTDEGRKDQDRARFLYPAIEMEFAKYMVNSGD